MIKLGSLFSGIGGFEFGFKQALGNKLKIEWACEIDKYARQIYEKHFKSVKIYEDARKIIPEQLKDVDIITAGFPCQSFSIAGKRKGFVDTRGTLYFEILRIAKVKRPKYLLLENVKGLLSNDGGRTFETILWTLAELGYDVEWQVLNSKNFGVPQNRERVFIVGYIRKESESKIFPIHKGIDLDFNEKTRNNIISRTIPTLFERIGQGHLAYGFAPDGTYIYDIKKDKVRTLTPIECERLQGFPNNYTEGISDTQRYKCLGNAVTVNVIEFLAERLFNDKPNGVV